MDQLSEGQQLENQYRGAGFSDDEINDWKSKRVSQYQSAGFSDQDINKYFGVKETDTSAMKAYVQKNLAAFHESRKAADGTMQKEAATFGEAFDAGWENSVTGLATAGHLPDTVLPEHAGIFHRIASNVGQIAGDIPAMWAGAMTGASTGAAVGGFAGSAVPGIGTLAGIGAGGIVGAGAGGFAAPAAIRKMLMDHYEKGDIQSAGEFSSRLAATTWEAVKGGTVGALTSGAGMVVKPGMQALGAELATMTTASAAMEGRLPEPQEFLDGAVVLGGFHLASGGVPTKLRNIFAKTGERPGEIVDAAHQDPVLKQELLSENNDLPAQAAPPQTDLDEALKGNAPTATDITGEGNRKRNESGATEPAPIGEAHPEELAASIKSVLSLIAPKREADTAPLFSRAWFDEKKDQIYKNLVDRNDPVLEAEKEAGATLDGKNSPFKRLSSFSGWKQKALSFIKQPTDWRGNVVAGGGTIDFKTGKVNGESLEQALSSIPKDRQQDFTAYAMSKRIIERTEAGFTVAPKDKVEAAKNNVASLGHEFEQSFQRIVSWNDRVMQYAKDAGLISEESHNNIKRGSKDYIPLMVEQDFDEWTGKLKGQDGGLYKAMDEGSQKQKTNPIEQMMRNGMRVVKAAELNQVKMSYGDMVDTAPNGRAVGEKIGKPTGADNEITFKRDGQLQTYLLPSDKAEAIKSMNSDPGKTQLWARMLMAPAGWLRTGTVLNPDFIARHGERAMFVSAVQSKSLGGVFSAPVDVARAMYQNVLAIGDIMKNNESWQAFTRSGGAQGHIFGIEDYLGKQNVWDLNKESGNFLSKAWNSAISPLEYMAHVSDNMARLAEFKRAGGVEGDLNTQFEAGYKARNVTLDYMRAGAYTKSVSSFIPFMNIGIQGIDRMAQGWKADPIGFTARASAALTVPTLLNWAANRNDSRYTDAPNWEKDLYWIIPTNKWEPAANIADAMSRPNDLRRQKEDGTWEVNNGTTLRISKPFELGLLFASVPERLLNRFADHDPRAAGELVSTLLHGALPNVLPTALTPLLEQGTNRNFFTKRPVVSSHAEGMLPEYQYNEYTSTVAKQLGKIIGYVPGLRDIGPKDAKLASPQVIDNYIRDWSGTLGQYVIKAIGGTERILGAEGGAFAGLGQAAKEFHAAPLASMPIIQAFIVRHPSQNLQPIQDFYDDYEKASRIGNTIKELMKKGDPASSQEAIDLSQKYQGDIVKLDPIKKSLGALAKSIQGVNEHPAMSPNDKRQLIDSMYYQMSMIAKQGNQIIDANRKALNAQH